ncbi:MAG: molybdenum cofactor guanylyltransferase, partial [Chroococcales cyanobacterium]
RMGTDKALIDVDGIPLLRKVYDVAASSAARVLVVTPWKERYQGILPSNVNWIEEVPLPDETKPHGPLVAFSQGLAEMETEWGLLLACDLPRLNVSEIQSWIEYLPQIKEDAIAFLPKDAKGWQCLCGFYRRSSLPSLQAFIQQGGRSFQSWLETVSVEEIPVLNRTVLFNCNTPEDLERLSEERE